MDSALFPKFLKEISGEIPGSKYTLNSTTLMDPTENAEAKASSFKMIIDFSSPARNMFVIPSGQSGHFISKHYDDQTNLWKDGEYLYLSGVKNLILGGIKGEIVISPSLTK